MKQENKIPSFLLEELHQQYDEKNYQKIMMGYQSNRVVSLRVNTLKSTLEEVCNILSENKIAYEKVLWNNTALIIKNVDEYEIKKLKLYEDGYIYLQSLSSMLPPVIMQPKENTDILDMTAAPGGKTTQIAALTNNRANITACEKDAIRIEKLKYNLLKQGATSVSVLQTDSRKLSDYFAFDQILLDAPCSGSGTIRLSDPQSYQNFSEKLVRNLVQTQFTLLQKALRILKPGKEMIYSTCSILSKENEEIISKVFNETNAKIIPIAIKGLDATNTLPTQIPGTLCMAPSSMYDGFFIAKIQKQK